jgi:hypothetical protein
MFFTPVLHEQHVVLRQQRRGLGPEIAEDQAAELLGAIRLERDLVLEGAGLGLGRLLQATAGPIVEPAVIRAAQAVLLDAAVVEGDAAVRAAQLPERRRAAGAAVQHQFFTEQRQALRLAADQVRAADRKPAWRYLRPGLSCSPASAPCQRPPSSVR